MADMLVPNVKAFISYSWSSEDHISWVLELATRLRHDSVDVVLDRWDLEEGQDKYHFMEKMVKDKGISRILAISDKKYADKADGREGGVGTETQILSKQLYENVEQTKVIPILRQRDTDGNPFLPTFLSNRKYIDFCDDSLFEKSYDQLLRKILGKPELKKPELGMPPSHLFAEVPEVKCKAKLHRLRDAVIREKTYVKPLLREYLESIAEDFPQFTLRTDSADTELVYNRVVDSIGASLPYRDSFVEFVFFGADYLEDDVFFDYVHEFLAGLLFFNDRRNEPRYACDSHRFLIYEMFLYLISILLKRKKYRLAAKFIEAEYSHETTLGNERFTISGAGEFCHYIITLDPDGYNQRPTQYKSSSQLLEERATNAVVTKRNIAQTDILLWLRQYFPERGSFNHWWPKCLPLCEHWTALEYYAGIRSGMGLEPFKALYKVKTVRDLYLHLKHWRESDEFQRNAGQLFFRFGTNLDALLNWKELERLAIG